MPSEFDDSHAPLLRITAIGDNSDQDIEDRVAFLDKHLQRGRPIALVFDTREATPVSAVQRRRWADWLRSQDAALRRLGAGCAVVTSSIVMRGIFTGIFWIWRPPIAVTFTPTLEEAERWARNALAEHRTKSA
jgi:hypothetical protein